MTASRTFCATILFAILAQPQLLRRFPPPWDIEEANASCFIVRDKNGQARWRMSI